MSGDLVSLPRSGLLTAREAAAYLTVTTATLRALTRRGELPCAQVSERNTRWHVEDLDAYVERLRQSTRARASL